MLTATSPFQAMVEGKEQTYAFRVTMTLPGGVYPDQSLTVADLKIDASTTTDVPGRLDEGFAAMQASFTLAGLVDRTDETKTVEWLFGRYSVTSPLYRTDVHRALVTIDVGLYTAAAGGVGEFLRKFTGYVDEYVEDARGGVAFTCIDKRSVLRSVVAVPFATTGGSGGVPTMTSEYAIDVLLRAASAGSISSWPAQRANCIFALGGRTATRPELGSSGSIAGGTVTFVAGKFGTAIGDGIANGGGNYTYATYTTDTNVTTADSPFVEFWGRQPTSGTMIVRVDARTVNSSHDTYFNVEISSGQVLVRVGLDNPSSSNPGNIYTVAVTPDANVHYIGVNFSWAASSTSWSATVYYDGTTQSSGAKTADAARTSTATSGTYIQWRMAAPTVGASIEALQITTETAPASNYSFSPQAVLDPSMNTLWVIPKTEGDPWQVIQQIAAAELAVAGFDEAGVFRYRNRYTLANSASVRTVTSSVALRDLNVTSSAASVINRAQVGYTTWNVPQTGASATVLFDADTVLSTPKKTAKLYTFTIDQIVTALTVLPTDWLNIFADGTTPFAGCYFRSSIDKAGTTKSPDNSVIVTVKLVNGNQLVITVDNRGSSNDCYLVSSADYLDITAGTPLLRVSGYVATSDPETTVDYQWPPVSAGGAAASRFGEINYPLTGNQWIQDETVANMLAQDIVTGSYLPLPDLTNVSIVPDPRLQLTDVVRVVDSHRTGADEYARIYGWTITAGSGVYDMTIAARTLALPGGWLMGVAGRSEIGSTAYVYA